MLHVQTIASLDLPELAPYRTMKRPLEHERQGIFVAEGNKVVQRLLQTPLTVISLLVTEEWLEILRAELVARPETVTAFVAPKPLLETLVGFEFYHGVMALARIPPPLSLDELIARSATPRLFVAGDGLANSENLGVIVRNCAAFCVQGLIVGETSSSPWLRRAVRNSMGGIFRLATVPVPNLVNALQAFNRVGIRTVAAHPHAQGQTLAQADLRGDVCLVFGSEGHGISAPILDVCAEHVAVPMPPHVDSLNVSSAAAVFLYEVARQRGLT